MADPSTGASAAWRIKCRLDRTRPFRNDVLRDDCHQNAEIFDEDISVADFERMPYPPLARAAHREGVAVVRARLEAKGYATSVTAISGSAMLVRCDFQC